MKNHFIQAQDDLKSMLSKAAAKVEEITHRAMKSVENLDIKIAQEIVEGDHEVDSNEVKIEEECLKILALHQPVASDLRTVITVLKVNIEIERIGDLAVSIAKRVLDMQRFQKDVTEKFEFGNMSKEVFLMLKKVLDSMMYQDVVAAAEVIKNDDIVDSMHHDNYLIAVNKIFKYPNLASYYLDCLTISRSLERIADCATNIAEDVIYMENGFIVRHQPEK